MYTERFTQGANSIDEARIKVYKVVADAGLSIVDITATLTGIPGWYDVKVTISLTGSVHK